MYDRPLAVRQLPFLADEEDADIVRMDMVAGVVLEKTKVGRPTSAVLSQKDECWIVEATQTTAAALKLARELGTAKFTHPGDLRVNAFS